MDLAGKDLVYHWRVGRIRQGSRPRGACPRRPGVAAARNLNDVAELVAAAPDRTIAVTLDVTVAEEIEGSVKAAHDRFDRIGVRMNNAGYGLLAWRADA